MTEISSDAHSTKSFPKGRLALSEALPVAVDASLSDVPPIFSFDEDDDYPEIFDEDDDDYPEIQEGEQERETNEIVTGPLSDEAQLKMEVIESLLATCDRKTYGEKLREAADKLGKSVRSVQRLVKNYEEKGLSAITNTERSDKGNYRISSDWQNFITNTYNQGNKGSRKITGLGAVVGRWEKLYLNPFPSRQELEALANVVMVDADRLAQMLRPKGLTMKPRPILLCAVCYEENPYHRIEWQFKERRGCDGRIANRLRHRHQLRLLGKCINCETPFPIPALWVQGECPHCFLPFARMAKRQKSRRA